MRNAVSNAVSNGTPTQPVPTRPVPAYKGTPVGHPFMSLQGGRESTIRGHITAAVYPGMNAIYTC